MVKPELNREFTHQMSDICQKLKSDLFKNSEELSTSHMKFVEESIVRIKLFYIFFDKLNHLANIFSEKSKAITEKYKEIVTLNKAKLKSEILVQDKFLEFNDDIDSIITSLDKPEKNKDSN